MFLVFLRKDPRITKETVYTPLVFTSWKSSCIGSDSCLWPSVHICGGEQVISVLGWRAVAPRSGRERTCSHSCSSYRNCKLPVDRSGSRCVSEPLELRLIRGKQRKGAVTEVILAKRIAVTRYLMGHKYLLITQLLLKYKLCTNYEQI